MTSRGLSESTTSRKPGVRIGLRLPTLRRKSTEKLSTRQRPYFNPPKCPANKSSNILNMGLGFFQTISSFPGSSFLNLDHGEEIEQLFQYLVLTTVFLYPQKSRAMQDSPAVGRWPWFVSFPLVYQAFAWPNQCRIHSFWMTMYIYIDIYIYRYIYIYEIAVLSVNANQWLLVVFGCFQSLSQSDCYDWLLLKMIAPNNGRFLTIDNKWTRTWKNQWWTIIYIISIYI